MGKKTASSVPEKEREVRAKAVLAAVVVLVGGYFLFRALSSSPPSDSLPPNVVVVLIDTLRPDYLGIYGHEPETAPFLAHIAEQSTVFSRAFSTSSWTAPSTASLFTSVYPSEHGVLLGFQAHEERMRVLETGGEATVEVNRIGDTLTTLPEVFKRLAGDASATTVEVPLDAELLETLRSLGYVE